METVNLSITFYKRSPAIGQLGHKKLSEGETELLKRLKN